MSTSAQVEGVCFVRRWPDDRGMLSFWCPGCRSGHTIHFGPAGTETWQWDGDGAKPTISPSILVNGVRGDSSEEWNRAHPRCHSFVRAGRIEFLSDCEHKLAGQTVELRALPSSYVKFLT